MTNQPETADNHPESETSSFDLVTRDETIAGRGVAFDSMALRWNDGARVKSLGKIEAMELESVMGEDISIAQCNVIFHDGSRLNVRIESDLERDVMTFRGFVLGLIDRLGPERRARIRTTSDIELAMPTT